MEWKKIDDSTYQYDEGGVRFFLLLGTEQALLIDSGMEVHNARELAGEITDLPVRLFNTHADMDHIGSNDEFDEVMINPAELVNYGKPHPSQKIIPIYDDDVIDIGERKLLAIALPGHTPGSTALLDENSGMLFSGDPIQDGGIFMFGPMRDMSAYIHSLKRLEKYKDKIKGIYANHGTLPVDFSIVDKLIDGAKKVEKGELVPTERDMFGQTVKEYDVGVATFLCE
ncbi:MBL fold metallo-hydrolase [Butyrivibrio sp. INlla16]|uniref:MBL fold metallo-hydrolase n=1 Tax=Butyrivibrio sp. INlla16 TaxID=1520807 RepID=UPI00088647F8|nr:MBL fold metallo-hydrolase [Butyrivibrio sp. INlla16]SDB64242.1 Glyoxylase, beta-lactamase superfamily II [Butyrivibrio sp. INlla16]